MKNSSKYLKELKSSQDISTKAAKLAQIQGRISPNRGLRYKTIVPLEAAYWGLGGGFLGADTSTGLSSTLGIKTDPNVLGGILGATAGLGIGTGIGVGVNKLIDSHGKNIAKKKIRNALDAGMITEKELKNYVKTGKVTPGIISALNTK